MVIRAITPDFSYSGITTPALESITTTLDDVQAQLRLLITPSTILLGQSLESDLRALRLSHPRCVDTALIFHYPRRCLLKPGLAWLTCKWFGCTMQDRGPGGHDPEEYGRGLWGLTMKNGVHPSCRVRGLIDG
jgi:RNA exonuclease 1